MHIFSMKITPLIFFIACLQLSTALMKVDDFLKSGFLRCYDSNSMDSRRISLQNIHGQPLPLPNSIETFISLVERYESSQPNAQVRDTVQKLLQSFRIDDIDPDLDERQPRDFQVNIFNDVQRAILTTPSGYRYGFNDEDFSDDEKCALHLMLSHTINDTKFDEPSETDPNKAKQPLELGVVNIHSKSDQAFALGRVLLGIYGAYLNKDMSANTILQTLKQRTDESLTNVNINPVYALSIGDLVSRLINNIDFKILSNGLWNDRTCPTEFKLEDNNGAYVSLSELRGAIDGLIIGKKIQEDRNTYANFKLSQILRMYYGYYGLLDNQKTRWCQREQAFVDPAEVEGALENFIKLLKVNSGGQPGLKDLPKIKSTLTEIRNNVVKEQNVPECGISDTSPDRKFTSPNNIFVIMDYGSPAKVKFQAEVIGNLSTDFDIRPRGNLMGVYTNMKPTQSNMLDTVTKNTGTAGCPSCFAKYYYRTSSKEDEAEVFKDLNSTLTAFDTDYEELQQTYLDPKSAYPGKVLLYFNYGSPSNDYRMQDAFWGLKRYYRGMTILAVGENINSLKFLVDNEQMDIFTGSNSAEKIAKDIKERLRKVPGEFQFRYCDQGSSKEAENKQVYYISQNKIQYWAMYPRYFLKSYGLTLKFKAQEGTSITVCFGRWYNSILNNDRSAECKTSNGEDVEFYVSNPCKKKNVFDCDPFYFSIEGKKQPQLYCESLQCSTPKDIQFEFSHDGISCNTASYVSVSSMALILATVLFYLQRR